MHKKQQQNGLFVKIKLPQMQEICNSSPTVCSLKIKKINLNAVAGSLPICSEHWWKCVTLSFPFLPAPPLNCLAQTPQGGFCPMGEKKSSGQGGGGLSLDFFID